MASILKLKSLKPKAAIISPKACQKVETGETCLKVKGETVYVYRAIDRFANLIAVRLSKARDLAAEAFFKQALEIVGHKPTQPSSWASPMRSPSGPRI
jgi:transposase-like protein